MSGRFLHVDPTSLFDNHLLWCLNRTKLHFSFRYVIVNGVSLFSFSFTFNVPGALNRHLHRFRCCFAIRVTQPTRALRRRRCRLAATEALSTFITSEVPSSATSTWLPGRDISSREMKSRLRLLSTWNRWKESVRGHKFVSIHSIALNHHKPLDSEAPHVMCQ